MSRFSKAVFLQFYGTVGAGIFALPYLFYKSDFYFSLIFLGILTIVSGFINYFYLEVVLNTAGDHQFSGYAQIYLGKNFKTLASLNILLLGLGATIAYIKLFSNFLVILFPYIPLFAASVIFIILLAFSHLYRFDLIRRLENIIPIAILLVPLLILSAALQALPPALSSVVPNFSFFGSLIFALSGFTIIPEIEELFRGQPDKSKHTVLASLIGLLLVSLIYLIFSFSVIRLSGFSLSVDSITGIFKVSPWLGRCLAVFGLLITYEASLNFLLVFRELFYRDFRLSKPVSQILPLAIPFLSLFLFSVPFIQVISLTGAITIYVSALMICAIRLRINPRPVTFLLAVLIFVSLTFGLLLEFG
ncbi:MAG: aromatic amino acid transport family protein [Candidatus Shapirobacteria bacterium]|jgi:amino acid permease